jgi:hypothetical protein
LPGLVAVTAPVVPVLSVPGFAGRLAPIAVTAGSAYLLWSACAALLWSVVTYATLSHDRPTLAGATLGSSGLVRVSHTYLTSTSFMLSSACGLAGVPTSEPARADRRAYVSGGSRPHVFVRGLTDPVVGTSSSLVTLGGQLVSGRFGLITSLLARNSAVTQLRYQWSAQHVLAAAAVDVAAGQRTTQALCYGLGITHLAVYSASAHASSHSNLHQGNAVVRDTTLPGYALLCVEARSVVAARRAAPTITSCWWGS